MALYLLDTNILLAWIRWGALQAYLQAIYQLDTISPTPLLSIVSEAELRVLALQNQWGPQKMRMMETLVSYLAPIPILDRAIVTAYVEIDDYSRRQGYKMGKNDLWIAAMAQIEQATIVTTDQDFSHLPQSLVKHLYVSPSSHL